MSIPRDTLAQIHAYVNDRVPPSDFLRAVFSNNLAVACCKADDWNRLAFFDIVEYVHFQCPAVCRGSEVCVRLWLCEPPPDGWESDDDPDKIGY